MTDRYAEIKNLYLKLGIINQAEKKKIRNTINTGIIYNKQKVGIATASSSNIQKSNS